MAVEAVNQVVELLFADVRRRTATEISKAELPALQGACAAVAFNLLDECVEIKFNLAGIFVRIDFEVAKLTALAAERDVKVKTERVLSTGRLIQRLNRVGDVFRFPLRERRIVRNKIIADFSARLRRVGRHKYFVRGASLMPEFWKLIRNFGCWLWCLLKVNQIPANLHPH